MMAYLATVTPFTGIIVYLHSSMGMPGSSEYLQDFMQDGFLFMIADALFIGSKPLDDLLANWSCVLHRMRFKNSYTCITRVEVVISQLLQLTAQDLGTNHCSTPENLLCDEIIITMHTYMHILSRMEWILSKV